MTEQGEVLAERYDDPAIAARHLEQVTSATLRVSSETPHPPVAEAEQLVADAAERAERAYRELVTDPAFIDYFRRATPIEAIETLQIGSRPARRKGKQSLEDLRAIPYTFAWTQSRHLLTGYYGLGAGLEPEVGKRPELVQQLYREWPFFRAMVDNAELGLAKSDLSIAREYTSLLGGNEGAQRIQSRIEAEHERSRKVIEAITGRQRPLEHVPWLRRSIDVRNPYVDPLNLIQVELMRRSAQIDEEAEPERAQRIDELLRLSIKGIAAGMRNTG
jgi:phosphoenolpyruvate carboxylase